MRDALNSTGRQIYFSVTQALPYTCVVARVARRRCTKVLAWCMPVSSFVVLFIYLLWCWAPGCTCVRVTLRVVFWVCSDVAVRQCFSVYFAFCARVLAFLSFFGFPFVPYFPVINTLIVCHAFFCFVMFFFFLAQTSVCASVCL